MTVVSYVILACVGIAMVVIMLVHQPRAVGATVDQQLFNRLLEALFIVLFLDGAMWVIDGQNFFMARELNYFISSAYYIFNIVFPYVCLIYVISFLNNKIEIVLRYKMIIGIPMFLTIVYIIANIFYPMVFYISEENIYSRQPGYCVSVLLVYSYMIFAGAIIIRKYFSTVNLKKKKECLLLAQLIIIPFITSMIQNFVFGISIIWISVTLTVLMIFIYVQNQQLSTDSLTGLNNRSQLDKLLLTSVLKAKEKEQYSFIMIDADDFKKINDVYGHLQGDYALTCIAQILIAACKGYGAFIARYGGDEFSIVCHGKDADAIIKNVREEVVRFNQSGKEAFTLSLSLGVSQFGGENMCSLEEVLSTADARMYEEKQKKK